MDRHDTPWSGLVRAEKITCQWARLFKPGKCFCQILWYSHKNRATIRSGGSRSAWPGVIATHRTAASVVCQHIVAQSTILRKERFGKLRQGSPGILVGL